MEIKHSKSRLEGFSDSVFAFAATLLVVSFEVPESFAELKELRLGFISFGLSFLALVLLWKVHYDFFRRVKLMDNVIICLNMILLFMILFYVYPLKFLANLTIGKSLITSIEDLSSIFQWYGLGFVLIFTIVAIMYAYSSSQKHKLSNRLYLKFCARHFGLFVFVGLVSILLAKMMIGISYGIPGFVYPFLWPLCYWHGKKSGFN